MNHGTTRKCTIHRRLHNRAVLALEWVRDWTLITLPSPTNIFIINIYFAVLQSWNLKQYTSGFQSIFYRGTHQTHLVSARLLHHSFKHFYGSANAGFSLRQINKPLLNLSIFKKAVCCRIWSKTKQLETNLAGTHLLARAAP